ncbi:GDP-L-fucose synthase [Azospirillum sp. TSO22-1]|uniref:GDP-L-fucose synthase n=1 Tax=Azospirillum sp. TSO22-1 TaxID=716789 RepID=UPI0018EE62E3|nr:GDP-L-fucose synthase [Azospirillum sp. TSO22-1]
MSMPPTGRDFSLAGKRVWVAGHRGMVGSALVRRLETEGCEILSAGREEVDLCRQDEVEAWMGAQRPQAVFISAATVGGIYANSTRPADFIYNNIMIAANIIHGAHRVDVEKLLFLGSSCIYPRLAPQPMAEDALLTGPLEPTNEWYAIAKIAGIKLCQAYRRQHGRDFIAAMPTNLYGPGDSYDPLQSHVLPALILKLHTAKLQGRDSVEIWGTGTVRREFLHVDDAADACVFLMKRYSDDTHVNVGYGSDLTIREVAEQVAEVVGFEGRFVYDHSKPDGTPRKLIDSSRLAGLGWSPRIHLREGIANAYAWFLEHRASQLEPA